MGNSKEWIKSYPIPSFFILTLLSTFFLLFPPVYLHQTGFTDHPLLQVMMLYASRLAVYSPVLVGMLITWRAQPSRSPVSTRKRWLSFVIVWIAALVISTLELRGRIPQASLGWMPLLVLSIPIAILPAFVISSAFSRVASLREYLSSLVRPRGHLIWYLFALFIFPMVYIMGLAITQLLTGEPWLSNTQLSSEVLLATLITFASVFFYSGGINEEGGWRGFAQRRLQAKYSPLVTNLFLWVYLVILHIPNDIIQYQDGNYLLIRIGLYPFIVLLFGWVYNRTRGSILAPALFHASMNSMNVLGTALPMTSAVSVLLVLLAVFAVLYDRMWKKLPKDHPAAYQESDIVSPLVGSEPIASELTPV